MDNYSNIRPYNDQEVAEVLQRLLTNAELLDTIAKLRLPRLQRWFPRLVRPLVRSVLKRQLRGVATVRELQHVIKHYMDDMIETTTTSFTVSGLENLDLRRAWLLISNHRDIALDPAFVNYALYHNGGDTVRIAIGDNLLTKPFAADLMRLNKSFIVKRSAKGPRQMLAAYKNLSAYIRHSLSEERATVWLAQREGRAKDGIDATEPAIIKMLCMSQRKGEEEFGAFIQSLGIVPVAISYEWDPCDAAKARELSLRESEGVYLKAEFEDLQSIGLGIRGQKGKVHVHFGEPLTADFATPADVAAAVDLQIIEDYRLQPSNIWAYEQQCGNDDWRRLPDDVLTELGDLSEASRLAFEQRMAGIPADHRKKAVAIYANAVLAKLRRLPPAELA
ncbi:MAG TPA: glycerol acyltransferase [Spongiibacteraceae bacterium]|nr:glycerol acyltransferase [Spongiibacteraceae bacterium]HCS28434.1 glycerol acyltransferase [Spongiibacteraceae bacterium]